MSPKYELVYFPLKGLGNMARILLEDQGIDYAYTAVPREKWPEVKPTTRFGQLPLLIVDGDTTYSQSHTIVRYLGREHGLMGSSNKETAQIEMYIDYSIDIRNKFAYTMYMNYENGKQSFIDSIPTELAPLDRLLAGGDKKFLLFGKVTAADYVVYDLLANLDALSPGVLAKTPNVQEYFNSFGSRPKLRAFLDKPEIKAMNFTGSPHL